MSLVSLDRVVKQYGETYALREVSLAIDDGEFVSVMGPSGSGKTTLLNLIGCLDKPTSGELTIAGTRVSDLSGRGLTALRRDTVGFVFQQFHLLPHLTAVENIMLAQYYHSLPERAEALEALERIGLGDRSTHFPSQLSGGEQQRVCIARALINQPALVLADEPTGNLDEENEEMVMDIFKGLHRDGHTIILVTHDLRIGGQTDRRIRLEHGRVAAADEEGLIPAGSKKKRR